MTRQWFRPLGVVLAVAALAGCGDQSASSDGAVRAEDRDSGFLLAISTPHLVWGANQPIAVSAELSYLGPKSVAVSGAGPGPHVRFEVIGLTGTRRMDAAWRLACVTWQMTNVPLGVPFNKSVAYSPDEPDAAFYQAYFDDPEFRLPAGRWQVSAVAPPFAVGGCSGENVDLRAGFTLTVK